MSAVEIISVLLERRAVAKKAKDFSLADKIRDGLIAAGVTIKDTRDSVDWELDPGFDLQKLEELL